jgi:signal transduction histidine kinase
LLGDLLDVSRIVHGNMDLSFSPLDIHECVRQAMAVAYPAFIAKELKLTVTLEAWVAFVLLVNGGIDERLHGKELSKHHSVIARLPGRSA